MSLFCVELAKDICLQRNCLSVNVVVTSEEVGQAHYEETKTEHLCHYCTDINNHFKGRFHQV